MTTCEKFRRYGECIQMPVIQQKLPLKRQKNKLLMKTPYYCLLHMCFFQFVLDCIAGYDLQIDLEVNNTKISMPYQLFIDGEFVDSVTGRTFESINPTDCSVSTVCVLVKATFLSTFGLGFGTGSKTSNQIC